MSTSVSARIRLNTYGDVRLLFSVAAARGLATSEALTVTINGTDAQVHEIAGRHGTRLHAVDAVRGGVTLDYSATIDSQPLESVVDDLALIEYVRPSRYCESDALFAPARAEFGSLSGVEQVLAVGDWVRTNLSYVPGVSQVTDGAVKTYLTRRGVCRDYAHLVIALLRSLDIPARLASVYAPGLVPMDFHAVAEAYVDGQWYVLDATGLAARPSLVRIATGRDAADTAFLTQSGAAVDLLELQVNAVNDQVSTDDHSGLFVLA